MSEVLGSVIGGSGEFTARSVGTGVAAIGVTTLVTVTPPAGQRVKLTYLQVSSSSSVETGIFIAFGAVTVYSGDLGIGITPTNASTEGAFSVGYIPVASGTRAPRATHRYLLGKKNEAMVITKSGTTISEISYGYEVGE